MPFAFQGTASTPAHDGNNSASPASVTPPVALQAGDLVVMIAFSKTGVGSDWAIATTGGQAWNSLDPWETSTNRSLKVWWCVFNGTWDANPAVSVTVSQCLTVVLIAGRPETDEIPELDVNSGIQGGAAPLDPFDFTLTGITTGDDDAFVLALAASVDDNELTVQTAGWDSAVVDNTAGTDGSVGLAWKTLATAGGTGNVTFRETVNGGDAWIGAVLSFTSAVSTGGPYERAATLSAIANITAQGSTGVLVTRSASLDATAAIASAGGVVGAGTHVRSVLIPAIVAIQAGLEHAHKWSAARAGNTSGVTFSRSASLSATAGIASAGEEFAGGFVLTAVGPDWYINGEIINAGGVAEGQMLNARMVQAIFDAEIASASTNPHLYAYPDQIGWQRPRDPDRNLDELIAQLPTYRANGLNMITICIQGGATGINATETAYFTGGTGISGWETDGTIKAAWKTRLVDLMVAAEAAGIVLNIQCLYGNRLSLMNDNAAVILALQNLANLILDPAVNGVKHFQGVLLEVANELGATETHTALGTSQDLPTTITNLRSYIATNHPGKTLMISFSQPGGAIPPSTLIGIVDYISLHAGFNNSAAEMETQVNNVRNAANYDDQPIMFTEAGRDLERATAAVVNKGVGWGYYEQGNPRLSLTTPADYMTGFQSPPVNWSWASTETKRNILAQIRQWAGMPVIQATGKIAAAGQVVVAGTRQTIADPTILAEGRSSTDLGAYTTGAFTPAANQWIVAAFNTGQTSGPMAPIVQVTDSAGLTWFRVDDANSRGSVTSSREIEVFYAKAPASPSSMTITFTRSGEGGSSLWIFGAWKIVQLPSTVHALVPIWSHIDTQDDDAQQMGYSGTGWSPTAPAFEHANNRGLLFTYHEANEANTYSGGYTKLGTDQAGSAPTTSLGAAIGAANDPSPIASWATSSAAAGILLELRAGAA